VSIFFTPFANAMLDRKIISIAKLRSNYYNYDYRHITMGVIEITMEKIIAAGHFKAQCLQLMDDVREKHFTLIITKHGIPVAKLVPIDEGPINLFGALKGTVTIKGDILEAIEDQWDVEL
jgi:prevent-host-death family protein